MNDTDAASVQTEAAKLYAELAVQLPGVPVVVFGVQPTNVTDTVTTGRYDINNAIKAACDISPNVIAFFDMIGNAGATVTVWASGSTYPYGSVVSHQGSLWKFLDTTTGNQTSPGVASRWAPLTYVYTGTGKVGTVTGIGNRDFLLHSDGIHPTTAAAKQFALRQATDITNALRNFLLTK